MKKESIFLFLTVLFFSCTNNTEELLDKTNNKTDEQVLTKSIVSSGGIQSTSNPELLTKWENLKDIALNTSTNYNPDRVSLPWVEGSSSLMPLMYATDIKKDDGWIMLFHTFEKEGLDKGLSYMCFYNELKGIIKIFYYKKEIPSSNNGFIWLFKTSTSTPLSMFTPNSYFSEPQNSSNKESEIYISNLSDNPINGLMAGWNGFQIEVPYSTDYNNITFLITAINKKIVNYNFTGKVNLTTTGTIMQQGKPSPNVETPEAIANVAGDKAKNAIDNITSKIFSGKIKNAISNIGSKGYGSAIKSGLNKILGSIFGMSNNDIIQKVDLKTTGTIETTGTSTEAGTGAINNLQNINLYKYYNNNYLGVWNIEETPKIAYERYTLVVNRESQQEVGYEPNLLVFLPIVYVRDLKVNINPAIEKYIVSKNITTSIFAYDKIDNKWSSKGKFTSRIPIENINTFYIDNEKQLYDWGEISLDSYQIPASGTYRTGYSNYYDWGSVKSVLEPFIVNVTIELVVNYNGKVRNIISSRNYKPIFMEDPSNSQSITTCKKCNIVTDCRLQ